MAPAVDAAFQKKTGMSLTAITLWLTAVAGFTLSLVSRFKLCSACSMTGQYRIFSMDFGWFGIIFFATLIGALAARQRWRWGGLTAAFMLFAAAGAETRFIWIQKYEITQWCPVCLGIAATVFLACCAITLDVFQNNTSPGATMKARIMYLAAIVIFFAAGLFGAIAGVGKTAEAAEMDLFLGKASSATTVYFVSDWFCPACRKAEPAIEKIAPELAKSVKVGFVDLPIHKETLNYTPYNLQFLSFEKEKYLKLRKVLATLALKTKAPTEAEVQAAVAPLGVKLRQMDYADILYGMQANLAVYRGYGVNSTPTVVVANAKTRKSKLLVGDNQITEPAIKSAISEVSR